MENKFRKWVSEKENKAPGTINSYSTALKKISEHYSQYKGKRIDIFNVSDITFLEELIDLYDFNGEYEEFGNIGNRTYINGLKTYKRFLLNKPKSRGKRSSSNFKNQKENTLKRRAIANLFDNDIKQEASRMSSSYEWFYCLERSIRALIQTVMEDNYGDNWWDKINLEVKTNVNRNLEYELDTPHSKRSEYKIDYTTFGDLRKIINANWPVFENKFNRNLNSVNDVMIDLNRLRVPIAHCTPLPEKEVRRLHLRIDDWHDLLKNIQ